MTSNPSSGFSDPSDEALRRLSAESERLLETTREWTEKLREPELTTLEREEALAAIDRNQTAHAQLARKILDLRFSVIKSSEPPQPALGREAAGT